jgi:hypothetical protein
MSRPISIAWRGSTDGTGPSKARAAPGLRTFRPRRAGPVFYCSTRCRTWAKDDRRLAAARGSPGVGPRPAFGPHVGRRIGGLPPKAAPAFGIEATEVPRPIPASAGPITEVARILWAKNHHLIYGLARWLHLR